MPAAITPGYAFSTTEQVTAAKLASLVSASTISGIDQTNMASGSGVVITSASAPSDTDAIWIDSSSSNTLKSWTGAAWVAIPGTASYTPTVANALTSSVIGRDNTQTGAVATGTNTIPFDDTIPQQGGTEGDEYMSKAYTPNNASNILEITVVAVFSQTGAGSRQASVALFQDSVANALAAVPVNTQAGANYPTVVTFIHKMAAGTTSAITFRVRIGAEAGQTISFNGSAGGRIYGGVIPSSITIREYKA